MKSNFRHNKVGDALTTIFAACCMLNYCIPCTPTQPASRANVKFIPACSAPESTETLKRKELKTLCGNIYWLDDDFIKKNSAIEKSIIDIKNLIGNKVPKDKVFLSKGVDFAALTEMINQFTREEIVHLYSYTTQLNELIKKARAEQPTLGDKISEMAAQTKDTVISLKNKMGSVFKSESEKAGEKLKHASTELGKASQHAKDVIEDTASRTGKKIKETSEKGVSFVKDTFQNMTKNREKTEAEKVSLSSLHEEIVSLKEKIHSCLEDINDLEDRIKNA